MVEDGVVLRDPDARRRLAIASTAAATALVVIVVFFTPESPRQWSMAVVLTGGLIVATWISEAFSARKKRRQQH